MPREVSKPACLTPNYPRRRRAMKTTVPPIASTPPITAAFVPSDAPGASHLHFGPTSARASSAGKSETGSASAATRASFFDMDGGDRRSMPPSTDAGTCAYTRARDGDLDDLARVPRIAQRVSSLRRERVQLRPELQVRRAAVVFAAARRGRGRGRDRWRDRSRSRRDDSRLRAARASVDPSALVPLLAHPYGALRRIAMNAIGARGDEEASWIRCAVASGQASALSDPAPTVRDAAARSLPQEERARWAATAVDDPDPELRALAASALRQDGSDAATTTLLRLSRDTDAGARSVAVDALELRTEQITALLAMPSAEDRIAALTRLAAAEVLALLGDTDEDSARAFARIPFVDDLPFGHAMPP
ncbi:MAG: hypothetical protein U0414_08945 [Polyangiaceae bacterium]